MCLAPGLVLGDAELQSSTADDVRVFSWFWRVVASSWGLFQQSPHSSESAALARSEANPASIFSPTPEGESGNGQPPVHLQARAGGECSLWSCVKEGRGLSGRCSWKRYRCVAIRKQNLYEQFYCLGSYTDQVLFA